MCAATLSVYPWAMTIEAVSRGRIAGNVRAEVARQQLEQERIAQALDQNQQYVSRRITGAVPWRVDELEIVADVLGMHVAELVGGRPPEGWVKLPRSRKVTREYLGAVTVSDEWWESALLEWGLVTT